jgi:glutathione synthase/RimK-type ligase-like ATP-grasp enzyme
MGIPERLYRTAEGMDLQPTWIVAQRLFSIRTAAGERYINHVRSSLNSHTSMSLAVNKYLTRTVLEHNNLPGIPFAQPKTADEAAAFLAEHGKIIVKPVDGMGARDIHIVTSLEQLQDITLGKYLFEKYIAGREMRYLVLNGAVIAVHRSDYGVSVAQDRALERISFPPAEWDPKLVALAVQTADVFGLNFAVIDYLVNESGQAHILEINTNPGLHWFHEPSRGPAVDVAFLFLQSIVEDANRQVQPRIVSRQTYTRQSYNVHNNERYIAV